MNKEFLFSDESFDEEFDEEFEEEFEEELEEEVDEQNSCLNDIDICLTEIDFYPPFDNRVWTSNLEDIDGGDNFIGYCTEFFEMLDEEDYYDN